MPPQQLTKELEQKARVFALVGDPTRIRMLRLLSKKDKVNVSDIAKEVDMSIACISHHLQLLKDNRIVESERVGNNIYYMLVNSQFIGSLIALI